MKLVDLVKQNKGLHYYDAETHENLAIHKLSFNFFQTCD